MICKLQLNISKNMDVMAAKTENISQNQLCLRLRFLLDLSH